MPVPASRLSKNSYSSTYPQTRSSENRQRLYLSKLQRVYWESKKGSKPITMNNFNQWLQNKNFSSNTIAVYQRIISYYGKHPLTTQNLAKFTKQLNENHEPATCQLYVAALKSYAKFQKIIDIDWEAITKPIPKIQKKFYTTINESELTKLKEVRFEEYDWKYQRNNLILDFFFYTGLRISELTTYS